MLFSWDYWLFMLPGLALVMFAQWWVNSTYRKWGQVANGAGLSGADAAGLLLRQSGLGSVQIEGAPGVMTDHYDPRTASLHLSESVARSSSVAALAIAAHEIGHADQDAHRYLPLQFRSALVPAVNFGSSLGWILILAGLLFRSPLLAGWGLLAFALGVVFALATLPVELNASSRAQELLAANGLLRTESDQRGVRAMLSAAAFTYVAALATAVLQLLYYALLVTGMGRRRR